MNSFGIDRRVLALALARMADSIGNSFLIVVLPLYIASGTISGGSFGLNEALVTGIILSAFGLLNSAIQPFAGRLSDRVGRRKPFVLVGLLILGVADVAYAFASSYPTLLAIRAAQGIGVAFTITATIALVNELASDETRGGNMGTFNTFRLLGFGAGPIAAGTLVAAGPYTFLGLQLSGFDAAFYIAAASAAISLVMVSVLVEDADIEPVTDEEDTSIAIRAHETGHVLDPVFTLGIASLFMAVGIALLSTIQPQVNARLGQGPTLFGIEFAAFVLVQVLIQAPIGSASDRYGRRPFILLGLAILAPVTLAQGLVTTPAAMIATRALQGCAAAMVFAPALALAGDLATEGASGTQLSVLTMAFGLGTAVGPLASGYLVRFGYITPFAFGAVLACVGVLLVYTQVEETVDTARAAGDGVRAAPQD